MIHEHEYVQQQYEEIAQDLDLKISSQFVPFSISRNAGSEHKSLNWRVTLSSKRTSMTFDYMKGTGHLPYPNDFQLARHQRSVVNDAIDFAVETGIARKIARGAMAFTILHSKEELPTPTLQEVLYSLTLDADVMNYLTYEQWASDLGYDPDSRKGEKIYDECRTQASKLVEVLGSRHKIEELRDMLQELDSQPAIATTKKPKI